jgi:predicted RNase H-like nuclease
MTLVLGVDGCRGGWCCVPIEVESDRYRVLEPSVYDGFDDVLATAARVICVDIPIGLLDAHGHRMCDEAARRLLKNTSQRVFSPPLRQVLQDSELASLMSGMRTSQAERIRLHRIACDSTQMITGQRLLSIQAFSISPKINQVEKSMSPALQHPRHVPHVCEVHPELCFWALNGRSPVVPNKKTPEGQQGRWDLLRNWKVLADLPSQPQPLPWPKRMCELNDYVDAVVAAWTAVCILRGTATCIPSDPPVDPRGLRMEMWVPR